jgi:hypothetical protein
MLLWPDITYEEDERQRVLGVAKEEVNCLVFTGTYCMPAGLNIPLTFQNTNSVYQGGGK